LVQVALAVLGVLVAGAGSADALARTSGPVAAAVRYQLPVAGPMRVVRPFQAPAGPYGAGHRGVDLDSAPGEQVRAAGSGVIAFAGPVAGRGVVVVRHPDGVSTEYEPVEPSVRAGQTVVAGQPVGAVAGQHPGCAHSCLHWGARRGSTYFDPLRLLTPLGLVHLAPLP
jgi:murein DD-endopeptidase MepM/ murein hydrolase activator NlpD